MKMENSRLTFLDPEFNSFMRTSSDPNAQLHRGDIRTLKSNQRSPDAPRAINNMTIQKSSQISKLTRADSYRIKPKETTQMQTMSNIEQRRKSKERRRVRAQSSPMFHNDLDATDPNLGKSNESFSNDSLKENNECKSARPSISRKKSFNALKELGLRKIQETARPILKRSQSQKIIEKPVVMRRTNFATDEDEFSDDASKTNGPLFPAITLFVPGYDHKTKSSTLPRKSSTPQLPRRSSKERMSVFFDKVITRQSSTPCLFKRDSKEKMKRIEIQGGRISENPSPETSRTTPIITLNNETNERITSLPADDDASNSTNIVKQRQAALAFRQKQFRERGTTKSLDCGMVASNSKVKQLASGYDDGSVFVKVRNLSNKTSELSIKDKMAKENNHINSNESISTDRQTNKETDNNLIDSSKIFEKPCGLDYRGSSPLAGTKGDTQEYTDINTYDTDLKGLTYCNNTGTESGYASLTDSTNLDKDMFADTLSRHDWRDFTADLCVTEL